MSKNRKGVYFFTSLVCMYSSCFGLTKSSPDLMAVLQKAAQNNPTYQIAVATYRAAAQALPISIAGVLPSLDLNSAVTKVIQTTTYNGSSNLTQKNYGLSVNQTIFNWGTFKQIAQAQASVRSAAYTLSAAGQTLMLQTAQAYYGVLQSQDLLNYALQQFQYISEQYAATQKLFQHREATLPELQQARGAYELIASQVIQARIQLYTSYQTLEQVTAIFYPRLAPLRSNFPLVTPMPNRLDPWVEKAKTENLTLLASEQSALASREAIGVQEGNYLPNITATGSYSNGREINTSNTSNAYTTTHFKETQAGLNAQWNIYEGGLTVAQVKQAVANYEQADAEKIQSYLSATTSARTAFTSTVLGVSEIKTIQASMNANTDALIKAQKAYRAGLMTLTEILQIQNQLYQSQKEYVNDLYTYLVNMLLLEQAAGTLSLQTMLVQNSWLNHNG